MQKVLYVSTDACPGTALMIWALEGSLHMTVYQYGGNPAELHESLAEAIENHSEAVCLVMTPDDEQDDSSRQTTCEEWRVGFPQMPMIVITDRDDSVEEFWIREMGASVLHSTNKTAFSELQFMIKLQLMSTKISKQ